ncbi:hypothetical protein Q1M63_08405 (plasmid) [Sinorhizobium meliloti]|nr:hypothetical protein Q1M63_08405 [Sinorhizobium meliloti]
MNCATGVVGYEDGPVGRLLDVHRTTDVSEESGRRDRTAATEADPHDLIADWYRPVPTAVLRHQSIAAQAAEEMNPKRCDMGLKIEDRGEFGARAASRLRTL